MYTLKKIISSIEHYKAKSGNADKAVLVIQTTTNRRLKFPVDLSSQPNYGLDFVSDESGKEIMLAYQISNGSLLYVNLNDIEEICVKNN